MASPRRERYRIDRARSAADELTRVAAAFESKALEAGAVLAHGQVRLAAGDTAGARADFEAAILQWGEIGAPYETALGGLRGTDCDACEI